MSDSKQIKSILQELYALDPSLKTQEAELSKAVMVLLEAKPEVNIDRAFLKKVRMQLLDKANTMMNSKKPAELVSAAPKRSMFWPAIGISFSGVAVLVMATFFVMQNVALIPAGMKTSGSQSSDRIQNASFTNVAINRVAKTAFGSLALNSSENNAVSAKGFATGMGGGGGMTARAVAQEAAVPAADAPVASQATTVSAPTMDSKMMIMPPYEQTITEYVYKGDPIELKDASLDVYKKIMGSFSSGSIASALRGLNLGVMNLASFGNASIGDFSVYQNTPFGYQIYISPRNGYLSIDQNWEQWQSAYPQCQDEACWASSQLKESDIPGDDELLAIADAFLKDHGISRESYGNGQVDKSWKSVYVPADSVRYVPDVVTVTYPLLIDNQETYQNGGMRYGISVMINVRVKKVSSVYNLQAMSLDASAYDAETDTNAILESAKIGGMGSPIRYMDATSKEASKKVEAELGTPVRGLVQYYQYKDNQSVELFVPALIFPVTKKADIQQWSQDYVIVPLVKGIESDMPNVYPLMRGGGAAESSASGSSGSSAGVEVIAPTPAVEPVKAQ